MKEILHWGFEGLDHTLVSDRIYLCLVSYFSSLSFQINRCSLVDSSRLRDLATPLQLIILIMVSSPISIHDYKHSMFRLVRNDPIVSSYPWCFRFLMATPSMFCIHCVVMALLMAQLSIIPVSPGEYSAKRC
jgi:hypothetical protein